MKSQTVFITGASSGIGEATAILLRQKGYHVFAGAPRVERMKHLKDADIGVIELDVTDEKSMQKAVAHIQKVSGGIDILINNAGYGSYGAFEMVEPEEARRQFDVNVFGLARLTQLVLPHMRKQKRGTIINISSIGGLFGEAYGSWYHASKYAVEGLTDSLALELAPFGIRVLAIEPGIIRSGWARVAATHLENSTMGTDYAKSSANRINSLKTYNQNWFAAEPIEVAQGIVRVLDERDSRFRYAMSGGGRQIAFLRKILPERVFYWFLKRSLK